MGQITGLASPLLKYWRIKIIKKYLTGGKILDYGCDNGRLADLVNFNDYIGVDINSDTIDEARIHYQMINNVSFFTIDEFLKINKKKFNFIILSAVIEHLDNPFVIISYLKGNLEENGRIIITTPSHIGNYLLSIGSKVKVFSSDAFQEHKHILSRNDFERIALENNFILEVYQTFEFGMNQLAIFKKR